MMSERREECGYPQLVIGLNEKNIVFSFCFNKKNTTVKDLKGELI